MCPSVSQRRAGIRGVPRSSAAALPGSPERLELAAYHFARRGAYRVVHRIEDKTHAVRVVRIDHRADVHHS